MTAICVRFRGDRELFASQWLLECSHDPKAGSPAVPVAPCETMVVYPPFLSASLAGSGSPWLFGSLIDL